MRLHCWLAQFGNCTISTFLYNLQRSSSASYRRTIASLFLTLGYVVAGNTQAAPIFADWDAGNLDGININVTETVVSGEFTRPIKMASDPVFTATYGSSFSVLVFGATGTPGNLLAEVAFSQALPAGSVLFAFDMDFSNETFVISSDLGFLSLLEQGESQTGQNSALPNYNVATGTLVETFTGNGGNSDEYSLFDASGISALSVQWLNGGFASGSWIAIATPTTVPLPGALPLLLSALVGLGLVRRKQANRLY